MPLRIFIASIGNPGALYNTLHSAGHTLLDSLHAALAYPAFQRNTSASASAHALFRSPSYMNESGPAVVRAFQDWRRGLPAEDRARARLLVLHDELETNVGQVKFKSGGSLKGHNGLKSVQRSLGGKDFPRIAVGIGRPLSRDPTDVSSYVLRKTSADERRRIETRTRDVVDMIESMAANESGKGLPPAPP